MNWGVFMLNKVKEQMKLIFLKNLKTASLNLKLAGSYEKVSYKKQPRFVLRYQLNFCRFAKHQPFANADSSASNIKNIFTLIAFHENAGEQ